MESSDPAFLNLVKSQNAYLKLFYLAQDIDNDIKTASENGFYGISVDNNTINAAQIADAHSRNVRVTLYGLDTNKENYDAISKQPDFIQTDNLDYVLRIFGKLNRNSGALASLLSNLKLKPSR